MKKAIHDRIIRHYETYFCPEEDTTAFTANKDFPLPLEFLWYRETESRPFQVLCTVGASEYRMPGNPKPLSAFNESILFFPPGESLDVWPRPWHFFVLAYIATYALFNRTLTTYGDTIDFLPREEIIPPENGPESFNMAAGYLMFPQAFEDAGILELKIPFGKTITFLQAMPITKKELDLQMKNGPEFLMDQFYSSKDGFLAVPFRE